MNNIKNLNKLKQPANVITDQSEELSMIEAAHILANLSKFAKSRKQSSDTTTTTLTITDDEGYRSTMSPLSTISTLSTTDEVRIGPNNTLIPYEDFIKIDWSHASAATRKLLEITFGNEVLATHTLSGKPSPAFKDKPLKGKLNEAVIADIIDIVRTKCQVTAGEVRRNITSKCADEGKKKRKEAKGNLSFNCEE